MIFRILTTLLVFSIFFTSCDQSKYSDEMPEKYQQSPKLVNLKNQEGYAENVFSGDTVDIIINSVGDTVESGEELTMQGVMINLDSMPSPQRFDLNSGTELIKLEAQRNSREISSDLPVYLVETDSLIRTEVPDLSDVSRFDRISQGKYILNSIGDTIPTGIPITVVGKKVKAGQPKPIQAELPRFETAAIYDLQYLSVDQGMTSTYIQSVFQDSKGNLWLGTWGLGVSKYDGTTFTHYTTNEGLSSNNVLSAFEDDLNNIWFSTYGGGLTKYDGEYFTHYTEEQGFCADIVIMSLQRNDGSIWSGTIPGGAVKSELKSSPESSELICTYYTTNEGLANNTVFSIYEDQGRNLWLGTGNGLTKLENGVSQEQSNFTNFLAKDGMIGNYVRSIVEDDEGNIWIGTFGRGVSKYDPNGAGSAGSFINYTENDGLCSNVMFYFFKDSDGILWFASDRGGVTRCDGKTFLNITENEGLADNSVRGITQDSSGNLWFATHGGGLNKYDYNSFDHFGEERGLTSNSAWSFDEDNDGVIWFGMEDGAVASFDDDIFTQYSDDQGFLENSMVWTIDHDSKGNVWFGSYFGAHKFDGKTFTIYNSEQGLTGNFVGNILEDKNGAIWFSTSEGLNRYQRDSNGVGGLLTKYDESLGLGNQYIITMEHDSEGNIWAGTRGGGAFRFNADPESSAATFMHLTEREGLTGNVVKNIFVDADENIWFSIEDGGICVYKRSDDLNKETLEIYTKEQGLASNNIFSVVQSENGNIYLGTDKGLTIFELQDEEGETTYSISNLLRNDGLIGTKTLSNSLFIDSKNRLWWGTEKSTSMLDLNSYESGTEPPRIQLRWIEVNNKFIDFNNVDDSLTHGIEFTETEKFENYPNNLKLDYDKNHVTFYFSGVDWSAFHKVKYSFRLIGQSDTWSEPSLEPKADYRNIPYGEYVFELKAAGANGVWSDSFAYKFEILPPWWHTWWARVFYVLFAVIIVFLLFKWRTQKLVQRQKQLEKEVDEATFEINQQKDMIETAHREMQDSINYAERIQRSFLATEELLSSNLKEYFVFFQPKEAVSGDFYWAGKLVNDEFAFVNADSTGHGVPGAIMSILNITSIEKAIEKGVTAPSEIFNDTRKTIIERLKQDGSEDGGKDGMDATLIVFNKDRTKMKYVAAQNPIWIIRDEELIEITPEKMPVGKHDNDNEPFVGGEFDLKSGDVIYTITDGFQDQFGGDKGKKFKVRPFKALVLKSAQLTMSEQKEIFKNAINEWKGDFEQVDDICLIGIKI